MGSNKVPVNWLQIEPILKCCKFPKYYVVSCSIFGKERVVKMLQMTLQQTNVQNNLMIGILLPFITLDSLVGMIALTYGLWFQNMVLSSGKSLTQKKPL